MYLEADNDFKQYFEAKKTSHLSPTLRSFQNVFLHAFLHYQIGIYWKPLLVGTGGRDGP